MEKQVCLILLALAAQWDLRVWRQWRQRLRLQSERWEDSGDAKVNGLLKWLLCGYIVLEQSLALPQRPLIPRCLRPPL